MSGGGGGYNFGWHAATAVVYDLKLPAVVFSRKTSKRQLFNDTAKAAMQEQKQTTVLVPNG